MSAPLNHGKEFVALCVAQMAADRHAASPYLTRIPRTLAQAIAERKLREGKS